jgi:secondary thiamine-phosphate synthase enzyme
MKMPTRQYDKIWKVILISLCLKKPPITRHDYEGDDDMPAHIKNCLLGCSVSIPITNGALNLGIWQGIYLCEHRNQGGHISIVATIQGLS